VPPSPANAGEGDVPLRALYKLALDVIRLLSPPAIIPVQGVFANNV
jgi:hypothetical protein